MMIPQLATNPQDVPALIPLPQIDVTIRPGVMNDVPFLDSLQKLHTKQVGWMPTATLEGKIRLGHVLIAESNAYLQLMLQAQQQQQQQQNATYERFNRITEQSRLCDACGGSPVSHSR